jgi:hypothetical protein
MEVGGKLHAQAALSPEKDPPPPRTHWIEGWSGPEAGLDVVERRNISCPYRKSNAGSPARSASLYRMSYPSILKSGEIHFFLNVKVVA